MGSVTCERCGFVSFATSEVCKQCGGPLPGPAAIRNWQPPPQPAWQQQGAPDWQPQQQAYASNWPPPSAQNWPPPPPHAGPSYYQPGYQAVDDGLPKRKGVAVAAMLCGLLALPVMIVGLIGGMSLGVGAVLACGFAGFLMVILSVVLGVVATSRVNKNPAEYGGKGMAITGIVLGCILLFSAVPVGIISSIAIPNLLAARRASNEAAAIGTLRKISAAQSTYISTAGGNERYGSLDELVANNLVEEWLAAGTRSGYRFEIEVSGDSFAATATPIEYPSSGGRSFYVSENDIIRAADKAGRPAGEDDPTLDDFSYSSSPSDEEVEWTDSGPVIRRANSRERVRR